MLKKSILSVLPILLLSTFTLITIVHGRIEFGSPIGSQKEGGRQMTTANWGDTCTDTEGQTRRNGEEWTVRQHFVMLCHQVPQPGGIGSFPLMRVEVIGCLREDGHTRMDIGSEVEEPSGGTLVCRRAMEGQAPTGEVRREWRRGGRYLGGSSINVESSGPRMVSSSSLSGLMLPGDHQQADIDGVVEAQGCFNKPVGARWQRRHFELECTSPNELPKLVACLPPELNGQRIPAGETVTVGSSFTISCEQSGDGSFRYRYV